MSPGGGRGHVPHDPRRRGHALHRRRSRPSGLARPCASRSVGSSFRAPSVIVVMVWKPSGLLGDRGVGGAVRAAGDCREARDRSCACACHAASSRGARARRRTRRAERRTRRCLRSLRPPSTSPAHAAVQGRLARRARPRRDRRPYRPERRRQDHAAQHHLRHVPTQCRYRHSRRYASGRIALARRCPPWDRSHVPDDNAVPRAHGAAETSRSRPPWRFRHRPKTAELCSRAFAELGFEEIANRKGGRAPLWGAARGRDRQDACRPGSGNVLLLDEPAAGLNDEESMELVDVVRGIRDRVGCGVLLIDHDLRLRHGAAAERMYVLDAGRCASAAAGTPAEVAAQTRCVIEAYLGTRGSGGCASAANAGERALRRLRQRDPAIGRPGA